MLAFPVDDDCAFAANGRRPHTGDANRDLPAGGPEYFVSVDRFAWDAGPGIIIRTTLAEIWFEVSDVDR